MELKFIDPRALKENPDKARRSKSNPQADALLLATIKAIGIVQPPVVASETDGGNGYVIDAGHRRVKQAIAAGLEEIAVLVVDRTEDGGAMRSLAETLAHEPLNPVDQWRAIERLVALGWTEEAIGVALAQPVRQIRKLRLLANVLPAMLDQMAKGDMPDERHLRTIASASLEDQKEIWKKHKPSKADPQVAWCSVAQALTRTRMYARDASFGEDLAQAYGIVWQEDLFAPADEDSRHTTDVEAYLGAQHEWMANHLPKRGAIIESTSMASQAAAEGRPRLRQARQVRPHRDVRRGMEMIGDLRTDALHEALGRAPIEDDTLLALLVLAFAGQNVSIASGNADGYARLQRYAARLIDTDGKLAFDREMLQQACSCGADRYLVVPPEPVGQRRRRARRRPSDRR